MRKYKWDRVMIQDTLKDIINRQRQNIKRDINKEIKRLHPENWTDYIKPGRPKKKRLDEEHEEPMELPVANAELNAIHIAKKNSMKIRAQARGTKARNDTATPQTPAPSKTPEDTGSGFTPVPKALAAKAGTPGGRNALADGAGLRRKNLPAIDIGASFEMDTPAPPPRKRGKPAAAPTTQPPPAAVPTYKIFMDNMTIEIPVDLRFSQWLSRLRSLVLDIDHESSSFWYTLKTGGSATIQSKDQYFSFVQKVKNKDVTLSRNRVVLECLPPEVSLARPNVYQFNASIRVFLH